MLNTSKQRNIRTITKKNLIKKLKYKWYSDLTTDTSWAPFFTLSLFLTQIYHLLRAAEDGLTFFWTQQAV